MPWSPSLTQLRDVLAEIYPDVADARIVAATAGLPISRIALQGKAVNVWHAILEEADKQGQVEAVVRVALDDYPKHKGLQAAAARALGPQTEAEALPESRQGAPMDRVALLDMLSSRLSSSDLRTLCFALEIDYDDLPGESKPDKARELIQYLERRSRLPELVDALRRARPDIDLRSLPSGGSDRSHGSTTNGGSSFLVLPSGGSSGVAKTTILFLASDPTDAARLRLGEELREVQEKLRLARLRDRFDLEYRASVRPVDISQALLDVQPQLVHFSGHGEDVEGVGPSGERGVKLVGSPGAGEPGAGQYTGQDAGGALYFEDADGRAVAVPADALAALFELVADQVQCVILNACYSEGQAKAIARHIPYVVGMRKAIGDRAAIAFSIGFYQALGAGRSMEEAYKFGCVQIRLQGIPEHLTPVLIVKE